MIREYLLASIFALAAFAGCVDQAKDVVDDVLPDAPEPVTWPLPADFVDPLVTGHDHADASLHKFSWRMKELYHHPMGGNLVKSAGAHAVDVQNGWLFVAAYGATADVSGGVYIYNLRNPEKPEPRFVHRWPGSLGGDRSMEVTDDANFIVLGTEAFDCAGNLSPAGPGLYLIDFRDKERGPMLADYLPTPGTHSLTIHRVKGADYVFATTSGVGGNNVFRIDASGARATLTGVGRWASTHDSAAFDDPLTGQPILYTAGGGSLTAYEITTPGAPKMLGRWTLEPEEASQHYVHAIAMQIVDGHRIVIVESEDWKQRPSPLWILDATDFESIERIANWTNPGNKAANAGVPGSGPTGGFGGQLIFSTHNPRAENGLVYLSHYHGGLWVLNVSSYAQAQNPDIMGYYVPHNDNGGYKPRSGEGAWPKPNALCGFEFNQLPLVFDSEVQNGIAYVADMHTGIYAVKLDEAALAAAQAK